MTQQAQQTTDVTAGQDATGTWPDQVYKDISVLYPGLWGPFTTPTDKMTVLKLYHFPNAISFGSPVFWSNGYYLGPGNLGWFVGSSGSGATNSGGGNQSLNGTYFSSNSTTEALIVNQIYLLPDHGAFTLTKLEGIVNASLATSNSSYTATFTRMDIEIHTISSAGVESGVLASQSQTGLGLTTTATTYQTFYKTFSITSTLSIASGTRLAIRIKLYGTTSNAAASTYMGINILSGDTYNSIPRWDSAPTIIAAHFQ